jgi:hypothetical protein
MSASGVGQDVLRLLFTGMPEEGVETSETSETGAEGPRLSHDSHRRERHMLQLGPGFWAIFSFLTPPPPTPYRCTCMVCGAPSR